MFTSRLTTYVNGSTPAINALDLNAMQDQAALLARLAITGRRIEDDFMETAIGSMWTVATTGTASASTEADNTNDGAGAVILNVAATASEVQLTSFPMSLTTRDFYLHVRVRHRGGSSYNYVLGLTSTTTANNCYIDVASGGSGAMSLTLGSTSHSLAATLGTSYSDIVITRISGVLALAVNGGPQLSGLAFATSLTDVNLNLSSGAGAVDSFEVDKICLLVDQ